MAPTVSVVIPAYNKGSTVMSAIESVLHQTFTDLEIIVVDDGSTDDTWKRVNEFGNHVRYIRQESAGVSAARNRGIEESRGKLVSFLDGDDLWLPRKLGVQLAAFSREPSIDAVQCSAYLVNDALQVVEARRCDPSRDSLVDFLLFRNLPALGSTLLARRDRLVALRGFATDLVILEDWDIGCRLARTGTLRSVPDFLVLYRQHSGNRSRNVVIHVEPGFQSLGRLFSDPTLDPAIRAKEPRIWARFFAMLAGGYIQNRQWGEGARWAWRAVRTSPGMIGYMAGVPIRHMRRVVASRQGISFTRELSFLVSSTPATGDSGCGSAAHPPSSTAS